MGLFSLLRIESFIEKWWTHAPIIQKLLSDKTHDASAVWMHRPQSGSYRCRNNRNTKTAVLEKINKQDLFKHCKQEKETALQYGAGCDQSLVWLPFNMQESWIYIMLPVLTDKGKLWRPSVCPNLISQQKTRVSPQSSDSFVLESNQTDIKTEIFLWQCRCGVTDKLIPILQTKKIWAAGFKTWLKLAKRSFRWRLWDGLWLESMHHVWENPCCKSIKSM